MSSRVPGGYLMCCVRQTHSDAIKHTYHVNAYAQKYIVKHNYHKTSMKKIGQNFSHKRYHFNSIIYFCYTTLVSTR